MAEFDAVLIGAGHNSLAAALHLAAKGWRVGVFEAAAVSGGAVKTGEYTLPGFRHDWAAMNLSLFAGSPFFKTYGAELGKHGCAFVPVNGGGSRTCLACGGGGGSVALPPILKTSRRLMLRTEPDLPARMPGATSYTPPQPTRMATY